MRAAFDVHVIGQRATGNETYADGLMRAFCVRPPGDIELFFYHGARAPDERPGERLRRIRPDTPYLRIPFATPFRLLLDRIDVVHFQYFAPPLCPAPTVLTIHDLSFERYPQYFSAAFTRRMRSLIPWMVRKAARVIAVSAATRDDLVQIYGLAPDRIDVIHNGAAVEFREEHDAESLHRRLARFGLGGRPFILCVGNLCRRKNQARVVRAFGRLAELGYPHVLVLVGKEEHTAREVRTEIDLCGASERIVLAGFVAREELVALYNMAEFSVYISHYEGFGLPVVESMACATPVLTAQASCLPEIAGDAALYVDPTDDDAIVAAMQRMIEDRPLRGRLRAAGLARSASFSWDRAAQLTLDTYRKAVEDQR